MNCAWIGNGESCTRSAIKDRSYCEDHIWQVYQKGTALGRRKKDQKRADTIYQIDQLFDEAIQELELEGEL